VPSAKAIATTAALSAAATSTFEVATTSSSAAPPAAAAATVTAAPAAGAWTTTAEPTRTATATATAATTTGRATSSASSAATACLAFAGFVDHDLATIEASAVQTADRIRPLLRRRVLDETEPARPTAHSVDHHERRRHVAKLPKLVPQRVLGRRVR
jgi:hypothetical protein